MNAIKKLLTPNPYAGSVLDLFGGRTRLPPIPPTKYTWAGKPPGRLVAQALRMRFTPTRLWPKCRQENLDARAQRVLGAFGRIGDLLG